ncbi:MAG TPA: pitrilysin family protein [Thermoanaerobaculia bacterium]|nr:pitrilysin family protein [Thermoanaerobaculia bacterium]
MRSSRAARIAPRFSRAGLTLAVFLAAALLPGGAAAAPRTGLDVEVLRLDNGMTFLLVDRPASASVAAGWVARVGSADDPAGQTGLAHLLEHLMFKGTRTIGTDEYDRIYGSAGATSINAFTTPDLTAYFLSVPANRLELWFWMESDRLLAPVFGELPTELQVIGEERKQAESTPTGRFTDQFEALFWQGHPYLWPRLGWPADAEALTREDAGRHFRTWYGPGNLTAVLAGRFDRARVREMAQRYFGRLPAAPEPRRPPALVPPQRAEVRMLATCDCPAQVEVRYRTAPFLHADTAALDVLAGLLNGRAGRLYRSLVLGPGPASQASASQSSLARGGSFAVRATAAPNATLAQLEQGWSGVLRALQEELVPPRELERVKNALIADTVRGLEDPFALMVRLLTAAGQGDWRSLEEQPRRLQAVTAEDVKRVARTYFLPESRAVALYQRNPAP